MNYAEQQLAAKRLREIIKSGRLHEDSVAMLKDWFCERSKVVDINEYRANRGLTSCTR